MAEENRTQDDRFDDVDEKYEDVKPWIHVRDGDAIDAEEWNTIQRQAKARLAALKARDDELDTRLDALSPGVGDLETQVAANRASTERLQEQIDDLPNEVRTSFHFLKVQSGDAQGQRQSIALGTIGRLPRVEIYELARFSEADQGASIFTPFDLIAGRQVDRSCLWLCMPAEDQIANNPEDQDYRTANPVHLSLPVLADKLDLPLARSADAAAARRELAEFRDALKEKCGGVHLDITASIARRLPDTAQAAQPLEVRWDHTYVAFAPRLMRVFGGGTGGRWVAAGLGLLVALILGAVLWFTGIKNWWIAWFPLALAFVLAGFYIGMLRDRYLARPWLQWQLRGGKGAAAELALFRNGAIRDACGRRVKDEINLLIVVTR